ncbi:hypothetical protein PHYPSEUDO_015575 [Phytophthora pseudosyringae]|uniref:EF-hand domain-containing protein n=1 Tax=Phytophthora pseudosyringae TaxID=221518 RepID=A0A8T1VZ01_9STRA|nr:hypothetical protein PHYPSEUDO_015575 [Phytophthora pseudosyringae]
MRATEALDEVINKKFCKRSGPQSKYTDTSWIPATYDAVERLYSTVKLEEQKTLKKLMAGMVDALIADFNAMKWGQFNRLDVAGDGLVSFNEFEHWLSVDPNLLLNRLDLAKRATWTRTN